MMSELTILDIGNYVERYLNNIFIELIKIDYVNNSYVINKSISFGVYDFWNKIDYELLDDFKNFSFRGDIIGTIFFFLSGFWEFTHNHIRDEYGRFPGVESFQYKKKILEEPVVEILVERLRGMFNFSYKDKKPKAFITHDIDHLGLLCGISFYRSLLGDIIKRKDVNLAFDKIKKKITNDDPWSVYRLIEMHKKEGSKGTFFFLPSVQPKRFQGGYDLAKNRKKLIAMKSKIKSIGGNIGIHYDATHLKEHRIKEDLLKIEEVFEEKIEIGRAHFLLFDISKSFEIYEEGGIKFDTTCSYADVVGFRFGTSKPFGPYNFKKKKEYNLVEIPLIAMDGTLAGKKYMNLSPNEAFVKIKNFIDKVERYNGIFTILWHNSSFRTGYWSKWEWVYVNTLSYLSERGIIFV